MTVRWKEKEATGANEREIGSRVAKHNSLRQPVTCPPVLSSLSLLVGSSGLESARLCPLHPPFGWRAFETAGKPAKLTVWRPVALRCVDVTK